MIAKWLTSREAKAIREGCVMADHGRVLFDRIESPVTWAGRPVRLGEHAPFPIRTALRARRCRACLDLIEIGEQAIPFIAEWGEGWIHAEPCIVVDVVRLAEATP